MVNSDELTYLYVLRSSRVPARSVICPRNHSPRWLDSTSADGNRAMDDRRLRGPMRGCGDGDIHLHVRGDRSFPRLLIGS